jgi:hypothetical protein
MTHAQLTIIAEAARDSAALRIESAGEYGAITAHGVNEGAQAVYNAVIKAGEPFVRTLHIEVD